jgi:hypothetical protein
MLEKNTCSRPSRSGYSDSSSRSTREATYRLRKVVNGRVAFAEVAVVLRPGGRNEVTNGPEACDSPAWCRAAARGAVNVLSFLTTNKLATGSWTVQIKQITGSVSDTRSDAIACASGLAVWKALMPRIPEPDIQSQRVMRLNLRAVKPVSLSA